MFNKSKVKHEIVQRNYFDKFSRRFEGKDLSDLDPPSKLEIETFKKFFFLPYGSKILEVGCGVGRYVIPLLKEGYEVTAVDISEESLNILNSNAKKLNLAQNLTLIKDNFEEATFTNCFDGAYAINLLHHLEKWEIQFHNMVQSIKLDGTIVIMEPNPYNPLFYPYYFLMRSWNVEKGFLRSTPHKLKKLFERELLKSIEIKRYGMLPSSFGKFWPFILKFNQIMCNTPVIRWLSAFVLIKGKKSK